MSVSVDVPARASAGARAAGRGARSSRRSRPPRSSACATSGSTTCSRRRPTRAAAPTRRSSRRSTRPASPYHRPAGGTDETVEGSTPTRAPRASRADVRPGPATLVVAGDLGGQDVPASSRGCSAPGRGRPGAARRQADRRHPRGARRASSASSTARERPDRDPDRPPGCAAADPRLPRGLGHERDPRRAVQLAAEHEAPRGEGLHLRRGRRVRHAPWRRAVRGPGGGQHRGHRARGPGHRSPSSSGCATAASTDTSCAAARDFLVGVFPLRFETPGAVVGALAGLRSTACPSTSWIATARGSRRSTATPSRRPRGPPPRREAAIVLVGDVDAFGPDLEAAGLGTIVIERDEAPRVGPGVDRGRRRTG